MKGSSEIDRGFRVFFCAARLRQFHTSDGRGARHVFGPRLYFPAQNAILPHTQTRVIRFCDSSGRKSASVEQIAETGNCVPSKKKPKRKKP
jgi:hypothetical protein